MFRLIFLEFDHHDLNGFRAGVDIKGHFIPGGTIIGASAWTIHAKEEIFGKRTEEFRPERWLEVDEGERKRMENSLFTFGYGSRVCIGKTVSFLEIYKVVPTLLLKFDVRLPVSTKFCRRLLIGF